MNSRNQRFGLLRNCAPCERHTASNAFKPPANRRSALFIALRIGIDESGTKNSPMLDENSSLEAFPITATDNRDANQLVALQRCRLSPNATGELFGFEDTSLFWALLAQRRQVLGVLVGVLDAVDHGDSGKHRQHPQHRCHHAELLKERSQQDEHDAFRPLHEPHLA